jgi:hypothetical protein
MAGGIYSKRFAFGQGIGPFVYTVPPGKVAVIKCLTACNQTAGAVAGAIYSGAVNIWIGSVPGGSTVTLTNLQVVLNAGEKLNMSGNAPGLGLTASGYELDAI